MSDMPNSNADCPHCGQNWCDHDKQRVTHSDGRYSYDYICPQQQGWDWLDSATGGAST